MKKRFMIFMVLLAIIIGITIFMSAGTFSIYPIEKEKFIESVSITTREVISTEFVGYNINIKNIRKTENAGWIYNLQVDSAVNALYRMGAETYIEPTICLPNECNGNVILRTDNGCNVWQENYYEATVNCGDEYGATITYCNDPKGYCLKKCYAPQSTKYYIQKTGAICGGIKLGFTAYGQPWENDDLRITMAQVKSATFLPVTDYDYEKTFEIYPKFKNKLSIKIVSAGTYYLNGVETLKVVVQNDFRALGGVLHAWYEIENPFGTGSFYKDVTQNVQLAKGVNTYELSLPITQIGTYWLNVMLTLPSDAERYVKLSDVVRTKFMVIPSPIYIEVGCPEKSCPVNYQCEESSGLCLRTDIVEKNITCFDISCPVTKDKTYMCTSAGICAEMVYQYLDCNVAACPIGATCDTGSGVCVKTEIYEKIFQCANAADCINPCVGVTASCEDGKCHYSGDCAVTLVDCKQLGCAGGYVCNNSVCERTLYDTKIETCLERGCAPTDYCDEDSGICMRIVEKRTFERTLWIVIIPIVTVAALVLIVLLGRKKK